jgi:hypothetical protein
MESSQSSLAGYAFYTSTDSPSDETQSLQLENSSDTTSSSGKASRLTYNPGKSDSSCGLLIVPFLDQGRRDTMNMLCKGRMKAKSSTATRHHVTSNPRTLQENMPLECKKIRAGEMYGVQWEYKLSCSVA